MIVVIGDALLDVDIEGTSERLCPDAPAPVVECTGERPRPGGAGLAASLAAADGEEIVLITGLGDDAAGARLSGLFPRNIDVISLPLQGATPVKLRVRTGGRTLVRLDAGDGRVHDGPLRPRAVDAILDARAVLVSDYGRGVAAHGAIRNVLTGVHGRVPVVWDPHQRGAPPIPGARLVTPNEREIKTLAEREPEVNGLAGVSALAAAMRGTWRSDGVAVTLGRRGALLANGDASPYVVPAEPVSGADTCGAGDRFAAAATGALAQGSPLTDAVARGVRAASAYVAGTFPSASAPRPDGTKYWEEVAARVRRSGGTLVATGGCFDLLHAGHAELLRQARALGDGLIVLVNSDESVRRLKGPGRPIVSAADRVRVLESLAAVDAVAVFHEDSPVAALEHIRPDIWVKGADYAGTRMPEAEAVRSWGGETVLLPCLPGHSTSGLVMAARQSVREEAAT